MGRVRGEPRQTDIVEETERERDLKNVGEADANKIKTKTRKGDAQTTVNKVGKQSTRGLY